MPTRRDRPCVRRALFCLVCVAVACVFAQSLDVATRGFGPTYADDKPLPLLLKLHKTGGTSVATALARNVFCDDATYARWRAWLDGDAPTAAVSYRDRFRRPFREAVARDDSAPARSGNASQRGSLRAAPGEKETRLGLVRAVAPRFVVNAAASFCGNYDGHWATNAFRALGPRGMRWCGGFSPHRNVKLIVMLRDPVPRFISRLYYELGGRSDLLLKAPFSSPADSWNAQDLRQMERVACEACTNINGGHCAWKGGLCDSPQEYLVVLSRLGRLGSRGALQRAGLKSDTDDAWPFISPPSSGGGLADARKRAAHSLEFDFAAVGVLEDLHTFLTLVADVLDWPLEKMLYASKKVHVASGGERFAEPQCTLRKREEQILGGHRRRAQEAGSESRRRDERLEKRANADAAKQTNSSVGWSGVFPLLGWNDPRKGKLGQAAVAYARDRNADDVSLWGLAKALATARAAALRDSEAGPRFDVLQRAYSAGAIADSEGFYNFCDWQTKDHDKARKGAANVNLECRKCTDKLPTAPCQLNGKGLSTPLRTTCLAGLDVDAADPALQIKYAP